jgi:SAM-dependent methyltransferase
MVFVKVALASAPKWSIGDIHTKSSNALLILNEESESLGADFDTCCQNAITDAPQRLSATEMTQKASATNSREARRAPPTIADPEADAEFRGKARSFGWDPDSVWIGGYVDYEWNHCRRYLEAFLDIRKNRILEIGCNVGASAIVVSRLGFGTTAVDVDPRFIELARLNGKRHGMPHIAFQLVVAGTPLPFEAGSFDAVICNSVLEYVSPQFLAPLLGAIDRVLRPGGRVLVLGTSNRLSPVEVHSGRWWSNYLPRSTDRFLGGRQRGIFPWQVTAQLAGYRDLVAEDRGREYLGVRRACGESAAKLAIIHALGWLGRIFGLSLGAVTPSFCLVLEKPASPGE